MLIIPKDILFKHATTNNVQYAQEAFLIIKWEEFPVLIDLITSTDFNRLSIDFKMSANSQH